MADGADAGEPGQTVQADAEEVNPVEAAADEHDADILLLNAPIAPGLSDLVRIAIEKKTKRRNKVVVVLVTAGGVADDAYRTATTIRSFYDHVTVCVSGWCKSAGTLMAIAAEDLIFGCHGEMGPLDVQIAVKDELVENRDSGLILDAAIKGLTDNSFRVFEKFMTSIIEKSMGAITFRTAAHLAADVTIGLMAPVYEKIDPLRMGADQRAQLIGMHYAMRLNFAADNLRSTEALTFLLSGYPSHGFVIDVIEAKRLFTNVKPLAGYLGQTVERLGKLARYPEDEPIVCFLDGDDDADASGEGSDDAEEPGEHEIAAEDGGRHPAAEEL